MHENGFWTVAIYYSILSYISQPPILCGMRSICRRLEAATALKRMAAYLHLALKLADTAKCVFVCLRKQKESYNETTNT